MVKKLCVFFMPHSVDGDILSTAAKDNGRLHFWTFAEPFR